jgi:methyltransferase-like protein
MNETMKEMFPIHALSNYVLNTIETMYMAIFAMTTLDEGVSIQEISVREGAAGWISCFSFSFSQNTAPPICIRTC